MKNKNKALYRRIDRGTFFSFELATDKAVLKLAKRIGKKK